MENVRFTGRVRKFKGHFKNVPRSLIKGDRWVSLCDEVKAKCDKPAEQKNVLEQLSNIRKVTSDIIGNDSKSTDKDDLAIKLYRSATDFIKQEMKTKAIREIHSVTDLQNFLKNDVLNILLSLVKILLDSVKIIQKEIDSFTPWGEDIINKMKNPYDFPIFPEFEELLKKFDEEKQAIEQTQFHMSFDAEAKRIHSESQKVYEKVEEIFDLGWLNDKLSTLGDDATFLLNATISELQNNNSNEVLQENLLNIVGYDFIGIIPDIIKNRARIVADAIRKSKAFAQTDRVLREPGIVQTTSEKRLRKLIEKDGKRERKQRNRDNKGKTDYEMDQESEYILDVDALREKREQSMIEEALKESKTYRLQEKVDYPFVFDKLAETARQNPIFVTGKSLVLPVNAVRKDLPAYEEISIPNEGNQLPDHVAKKYPKIPICDLDPISKMVFKGMTSLNQLQSIVFHAAINSNENLLVAAPTGAGKTNVAMLTCLNCIKAAMSDTGVLNLKSFKIIYVAPMKALAAEITGKFQERLKCLGIKVREYTGDMSLTKKEIEETQMLVTTPEKWDVLTRKRSQDVELMSKIKLLILDEIHLLQDTRGAVIEALVARTLRMVNTSQQMIRIVGLSATLPNYVDVAKFLRVNLESGLFFFDGRFRPVPLDTKYIGVKARGGRFAQMATMDERAFQIALKHIRNEKQVMVFVHSRNSTAKTCEAMMERATKEGVRAEFEPDQAHPRYHEFSKKVEGSRNRQIQQFFRYGFGIHHAGMIRAHRSLVEKLYEVGLIKVLSCTSTLAWGVNLPAYAVIIKGTDIYVDGNYIDLSVLDVQQIFGRAGRPQYDTSGEATIITTHDKLAHYVALMIRSAPIESQFLGKLADNLNAEISSGSVSCIDDAIIWLSYTYLDIRLMKNPFHYGINRQEIAEAGGLHNVKSKFIANAASKLDQAKMIRFNTATKQLSACDMGRTASHFYIRHDSIEMYNTGLEKTAHISTMYLFDLVASSKEFEQLKIRNDEMEELDRLSRDCEYKIIGGVDSVAGKVNCLLQTYLNNGYSKVSSLNSDLNYLEQNAGRITRGLFEITRKKGMSFLTNELHKFCLAFEQKMWWYQHPFYQFKSFCMKDRNRSIMDKIEHKNLDIEKIREMPLKEVGQIINDYKGAEFVKKMAEKIPKISIAASVQPITRTIVRIVCQIDVKMLITDKERGGEPFWIWVEDSDNDRIYHCESFMVGKKNILSSTPVEIVFTVPLPEVIPSVYMVKVVSDRWFGAEETCALDLKNLIVSELHPAHTELLDLQPLPISALQNETFQKLYSFSHFNPIQTQVFHCLYHNDANCLVGAPTGSGKTICSELAMLKVFRDYPGGKVVYIAPLKALVKERMEDWSKKLKFMGKKLVEMTGDIAPDQKAITSADIIITTPEKWDGISRSWQTRKYVRDVRLIIIDEIHMLGEDRGPVLESIVTRTNFISNQTKLNLRVVGLSTALANARDLADWLGIKNFGLYNFKPSVRPVPMRIHVQGFPGKHYCPRMALMNKPIFVAIKEHSPKKPILVFVASRRQTRLTALALISLLASNDNPKLWINYDKISDDELDLIIDRVKDTNLKHTLEFGIGMHHAGLVESDRKICEELFLNMKIQVLIATSTLAWGVNLPAHMVIVKGTEYFDGKQHKFVDFAITDVLQMVGRAGRPQFDTEAVAMVFSHDIKKNYYKKFLYEPFPVESNLLAVLPDHLNAEVVAGTIKSKQDALNYLTWTYFFRRLLMNPNYYQLESLEGENINNFLSELVEKTVLELIQSGVIELDEEDENCIYATSLGRLTSYYYLKHTTSRHFARNFSVSLKSGELLTLLTEATEFSELPVRHNEDQENEHLAKQLPLQVDARNYESPHVKANLLLQCHMSRGTLPSSDYLLDTKTVMDNAARVLQAMIDMAAELGFLTVAIRLMRIMQGITQGRWPGDDPFLMIPHVESKRADFIRSGMDISCLGALVFKRPDQIRHVLESVGLAHNELKKAEDFVTNLPSISLEFSMSEDDQSDPIKIPKTYFTADIRKETSWIKLPAGEEFVLQVKLTCNHKSKSIYAQAPRYPKPKLEGWFIALGDSKSGELMALKKINQISSRIKTESIWFEVPDTKSILSLYFISDSYIGLDQVYDIRIDPIKS